MYLIHTAARLRRRSWLLFWVLGCACDWANAAPLTDRSEPYSLTTLMLLADQRSPDVAQLQFSLDVSRARLIQAGQRPNPRLELSAKSGAVLRNEGEYSTSLGVSQTIPMAGRIHRQQDVARVDIALSELNILDAKRTLKGAVAQHFYAIQTLRVQLASQMEFIATQKSFLAAMKDRLRLGEVSALDVAALQLDLEKLEQEHQQIENQQHATLQALNSLLNHAADDPLRVVQENPRAEALPALPLLLKQAESTRIDVRRSELMIERAQAELALAQALQWEDWNAGIGLEQSRQIIEGAPSQSPSRAISVSVSIPLPLSNKNQGQIAQANAELQQAKIAQATIRLQLQNEVTSLYTQTTTLFQQLQQFETALVPAAQKNLAMAKQAFQQGQVEVWPGFLRYRATDAVSS